MTAVAQGFEPAEGAQGARFWLHCCGGLAVRYAITAPPEACDVCRNWDDPADWRMLYIESRADPQKRSDDELG